MVSDDILATEPVEVFLTESDSMCLRRLMEHDVHHPGDLSASQAQAYVVGNAVAAMFRVMDLVVEVKGQLVLKYEEGDDERIDWCEMYRQAHEDEGDPNTTLELLKHQSVYPLDIVCKLLQHPGWFNTPTNRAAVVRFALRWRHYCWRHWKDRQANNQAPKIGIAFEKEGCPSFIALVA